MISGLSRVADGLQIGGDLPRKHFVISSAKHAGRRAAVSDGLQRHGVAALVSPLRCPAPVLGIEGCKVESLAEHKDVVRKVAESSRDGLIVATVAFSPDGKMLASASWDQAVRLWDVATRQLLGEPLIGHTSYVTSVAFSPDGKTMASASRDKTVRLWDVATRQPLGEPLQGHTNFVYSVAFSPDGKTLASASADETVRLWDVDLHSWEVRACVRANRNLSLEEWHEYLGKDVPYHRTCPNLPAGAGVRDR